jgi:hypothetical protein
VTKEDGLARLRALGHTILAPDKWIRWRDTRVCKVANSKRDDCRAPRWHANGACRCAVLPPARRVPPLPCRAVPLPCRRVYIHARFRSLCLQTRTSTAGW